MAISDLFNELQKDSFKMDSDSEKKIVRKLLEMVATDKAAEVRAFAVKCLPPLVKKVHEDQAIEMFDKLAAYVYEEKEEQVRDVAGSGLRTMIDEYPDEQLATMKNVLRRLTPRLISGISAESSPQDVLQISLDLMNDILAKYGKELTADAEKIQKAVIPHITSKTSAAKKKAISCLGYLSNVSSEKQFTELMEYLLSSIPKSKKADVVRTYIQAIGNLSRSVGYRMGKQIPNVVPLVLKFVNHPNYEEDDELREICFQTFESLIYRCPQEITEFLQKIIEQCLTFIKHDPNYAVGSDEDEDAMDVDEDDDDDDDGGYSDDDDMSWKVRKASSRCLCAVIRTRPEMIQELYKSVAPVLVARFSEREENVKLDIFGTFGALLSQTSLLSGGSGAGVSGPSDELMAMVPKIVASLSKQLKDKKTKPQTRIGCFAVLRQLVQVLPGCLSKHVGDIISGVQPSFDSKSSSSPLKTETLLFLRTLLSSHPAAVFHPHIKPITSSVYKAVGDSYYKITAEALRVCSEIVKILRPAGGSFDYKPFVTPLYNAVQDKFSANDIDQEVKEEAINCVALLISLMGDELKEQTKSVLKVLVDRLRNEITRLTAVRAVADIASSSLKIDLSSVLADIIKELSSFLRKQNRQLKQQTLNALVAVVQHYGSDKSAQALFDDVLKDLAALITDSEMHLAHLALRLVVAILKECPASAATVATTIFPAALNILTSSLLQGLALESLLAAFTAMLQSGAKALIFDSLLDSFINLVAKRDGKDELSRAAYSNIGQCIAAIVAVSAEDKQTSTVQRFLSELTKGKGDAMHLLAVFAVGEIGRRVDLSGNKDLKKAVLACFDNSNEDVKSAASVALGGIAVGNMEKFLPELLAEVDAQPKRQYLLLGAMREVIVSQSRTDKGVQNLAKFFDHFSKLLFTHTNSNEEGTRNIVAECLGKLALVNPAVVIPELVRERSASKPTNTRATVVSALKFAILERANPSVDDVLASHMGEFLDLLSDPEVAVRHATLLAFNYAIHHKPQLVRPILQKYLPALYGETKVKPELITEVELGPFKHKVDNGQPLRQAAFECMYTLLDTCLDRLDLTVFIQHVKDGLGDHHDIRTLNHLMVAKLAHRASASLLHGLDLLIEPMRVTITTKVKDNAVQHERERNEELIRSALRAVAAVSRIPNVDDNQKFADFLKSTVLQPGIKERYDVIVKEVNESMK